MQNNIRLGMLLMIGVTIVFAVQDGISRHLAGEYNVLMVVMIRYWFFAAFVITIAQRQSGSIRAAAATKQPIIQAFRGLLLASEICVMVAAFVLLGLVESHAIFACYPLLVAALSGPIHYSATGVWRLFTLRFGRADLRQHVRTLLPAYPLCGAQGRYCDLILLDWHSGRGGHDDSRHLVLGADEPRRLDLDGLFVPDRRIRALAADQVL